MESYKRGLDEEINYVSNGESVMSEQGTIDKTDVPNVLNLEPDDEGMNSNDDVDEWFVTEMEEHKKTSETDIVLKVSSMASNNIVEEDSRPSRTLPCQLQPSGEDHGIWPTCNPDLRFCSGYGAVYGKEWLKVKIGHTNITNSDREKVFNEWVLDSFDVEADYAKMFANPYSRRFDEYMRIFINEVEQLSNEYGLKIGKKRYVLDDV
ncbi:hypothetical protein Tco_0789363 [Tanacetum coccineum]